MNSNRPDILFFMVDQLSAKWLEAALNGVCPLPHFARLREMGTTFNRVFTSNPVCCPTRSTLATGLSSRGHGVIENGYQLDPKLPTFMRALQNGGWRTGAFGKVHFQPHFRGLHPDYKPYGFDVTCITEDSRGGPWLDWVMENHPEHLDAVLTTIWAPLIPDFASYGPRKLDFAKRIRELRAQNQWGTERFPDNNREAYTLPFPEEVSQTNWITDRALDYLHETPREQPLFAHVSYVQPHSPFCAPEADMDKVDVARLPEPLPAPWNNDPHLPAYLKSLRGGGKGRPAPQQARHFYFADLVHLDRQLGRVLDALEARGKSDNTFIVFLSDHGELLGDFGMWGKESRHYDACIRVPLTVVGPGVAAGASCDAIVQLEDICPTVLEMASVHFPPMPHRGPYLAPEKTVGDFLPGHSLLALCRDAKADWPRRAAYVESFNTIWEDALNEWSRTVRTADARYTYYADNGGEQLFDLNTDPDELHNVVAQPEYAALRGQLRDQLLDLLILQDYPKPRRELFALGVH